jgi:hypothetical protein
MRSAPNTLHARRSLTPNESAGPSVLRYLSRYTHRVARAIVAYWTERRQFPCGQIAISAGRRLPNAVESWGHEPRSRSAGLADGTFCSEEASQETWVKPVRFARAGKSLHSGVARPLLARNVSAGTPGHFQSWGQTGCAIRLPATAALDPFRR